MIQRQAGCDRFEPTAGSRTDAQLREILIRPQKDLLRNVLRLGVIAREARGRREDHVLIGLHESCEFSLVLH